jgi:hypothetical protein
MEDLAVPRLVDSAGWIGTAAGGADRAGAGVGELTGLTKLNTYFFRTCGFPCSDVAFSSLLETLKPSTMSSALSPNSLPIIVPTCLFPASTEAS